MLKNSRLVTISPVNLDKGLYVVDVYSDDKKSHATFHCDSEIASVRLRNAIREHATGLLSVTTYLVGVGEQA